VTNALLTFAAAGIGFGGEPWAGFAAGASLVVLLGIPQQVAVLKQYAGEPKTDIVLALLFGVGLALAGTLASAWAGYGLRNLLATFMPR
jgi:hypothetical protein